MGDRFDFVEFQVSDVSTAILDYLDDPADIVRASAVSRAWRHFVVTNGFSKKLCLKMYPEVSKLTRIVEVRNSSDGIELSYEISDDLEGHLREHKIFMSLIRRIMSEESRRDIILDPVSASSTDNYPGESIDNTLEPSDLVDTAPSYWSSAGSGDPDAPETLTYRLNSRLCTVCEIKLRPFQAYFQPGNPIYSAKAVRFKIGHLKQKQNEYKISESKPTFGNFGTHQLGSDDFAWTYVSPIFPMTQVNALQSFKLPRPVLCIEGFLQIELLGRVQTQETDNLYYICVCHVRVTGIPHFPEFDVGTVNDDREAELRYYPEFVGSGRDEGAAASETVEGLSGWQSLAERIRLMRGRGNWNQVLLNALLGHMPSDDDEDTDDDGLF